MWPDPLAGSADQQLVMGEEVRVCGCVSGGPMDLRGTSGQSGLSDCEVCPKAGDTAAVHAVRMVVASAI